ncbi:MAG: alpha/beta hydrolase [Candidatus Hydrogenedentes bacterium]|nr:alpha/beta hydrolase [Candidatus Hydrogenedentota bacterium]
MKLQYKTRFMTGLLVMLSVATHAAEDNTITVTRDIQYTINPDSRARLNQLDIYAPNTPGPHPVLVFIHGGSWRFGDKRMVGGKPEAFTTAGYVFVSINYRLSPEVQHPAHAQDCGKAIAWIHKNIAQYGGDPKRIYVMGHSAGAHLAALIATDETYLKEGGCDLSAIRGAIVLDGGGYDIPTMVNSGELFAKGRYERAFGKSKESWRNASPITHVAKNKKIPPFLLVHAGERVASQEQADGLAAALTKAGITARQFDAPDKNHLTLNSDIGEKNDATTKEILAFMEANGAKRP